MYSPLAESLDRVRAISDDLSAGVGPLEGEWFAAADLANRELPLLEQGLAISIANYPGAARRAAGSFLSGHYVWYLLAGAVGVYLKEQRVPDLDRANVAMRAVTHHHEGENGEVYSHGALDVRFLSGRFGALPADPAAASPDAIVFPDAAALREWMRSQLEAHIAPMIDAIYGSTRLGRRAQWNIAADSCARLFQWAGQQLGDEAHGCAEGLRFVKQPGSNMLNRDTGFITLEYAGHRETFTTRSGCCLYYTVPGGEKCQNCILRSDEERERVLLDYMATKYAAPATV